MSSIAGWIFFDWVVGRLSVGHFFLGRRQMREFEEGSKPEHRQIICQRNTIELGN